MRPMKQTSDISAVLIEWYGRHFRPLPWRETSDPYLIWLSEVILQQTRVAQGLDYFRRFASRFPDVRSLAAATEDEVLKLWQGLAMTAGPVVCMRPPAGWRSVSTAFSRPVTTTCARCPAWATIRPRQSARLPTASPAPWSTGTSIAYCRA